jgi:hypothetical protein
MRAFPSVGLAVALALGLSAPVTAATTVSPGAVVIDRDCVAESIAGDAARDARGVTRGFVVFEGGTCGAARRIWWFAGSGDDWDSGRTPYRGMVMAATADGDMGVVLFANGDGTFLGRRRANGTFTPTRRLSRSGLTGAVIPSGDVVAMGGRFWAVWSEQVGPGGEFAQTELFQSQNIGQGHYFDGVMPRTRITRSRSGDDHPTLVAEPPGVTDQTFALAWSRNDGARGLTSDLMFARATADGVWQSTRFATRGYNTAPDLFATGRLLWLAWTRDGHPALTSRTADGWRTGRTFSAQRALDPSVATSGGEVFLGWTTPRSADISMAHRDGAWEVVTVTRAAAPRNLLAVTSGGGRATVVLAHPAAGRVVARGVT